MSEFEITYHMVIVLVFGGFCAGFVDSIAGGGGLISLPLLLSLGLPPQLALGTNKLQGSFGTFSASCNYIRNGKVDLKSAVIGIFFTFIGAVLGAGLIQRLDPAFIKHLVPILLIAVFFYTLISKDLGFAARRALMKPGMFFFGFGIALGFYDGFFGPGTGSFWTVALMVWLGQDMAEAAGVTRVMNFTSNIIALFVFVMGHNVLYSAGLSMAGGQIIGARIGSGMAIKKGARFIRPIFLSVVFLTIVRLGYIYYFKA